MIFAIAVLALAGVAQLTNAAQYCANILPGYTNGASGNVALQISEGSATYGLYLDLTNFTPNPSCNLTQGLNYHIHSYWNNQTSSSASNSFCGATNTGGHYDPNFACSPYSQNYSNACLDLGRQSPGYTYSCSSTVYSEGKYSACEIGDISGKNGKLMPKHGTLVFELSTPFVDYQPPYEVNYNAVDTNSLQWTSVVFHCPATNGRLVCAKFSTADLTPCDSTFSTFSTNDDNNDNNDDKYSKHQLDMAVVASVLVCFFVGLILGAIITRWCCRIAPSMSSSDSKV